MICVSAEAELTKLDLSKMEFPDIQPDPIDSPDTLMLEYNRTYNPLKTVCVNS